MLTNREWATLFWFAVLLAILLRSRDGREIIAGVLSVFKSLLPLLLPFAVWMAAVVWAGAQLGLWQTSMLTDTILWSVPGLALFLASTRAGVEVGFFRKRVWATIGLATFVGFYLGLGTLDLLPEILLQFVIFSLVATRAVADYREDLRSFKRPAEVALGLIGLALLIPPAARLISDWESIDSAATLRGFVLPVLLTLAAFPYIYLLSLCSTYDQVFNHLSAYSPDRRVSWRARLAVVLTFHLRLRALAAFNGNETREIAVAGSLLQALCEIDAQRTRLRPKLVPNEGGHH